MSKHDDVMGNWYSFYPRLEELSAQPVGIRLAALRIMTKTSDGIG